MNNHGNRHAPRFTSLHTKRRTKYRRKMLAQSIPDASESQTLPKSAAMPDWMGACIAHIANARDALLSLPGYLSRRQQHKG